MNDTREAFEHIYKICINAMNNTVGKIIPDESAPIRYALQEICVIAHRQAAQAEQAKQAAIIVELVDVIQSLCCDAENNPCIGSDGDKKRISDVLAKAK